MTGYIYGDVLFGVNFVMNALILWGTSRYAGARAPWMAISVAAAAGALYSVVAAWLQEPLMESIPAKVLLVAAMVWIAFPGCGARRLARLTLHALTFSFLVAGATMAVWASSWGISGWVYPLRWWGLAVATVLAGGAARLAASLLARRPWSGTDCMEVEVGFNGETAGFKAFLDTGNRLEDPVTGDPVLVAEVAAVRRLIPPDVRDAVIRGDLTAAASATGSPFASRIRVLPFSSLGEAGGILIGFRPDSIVVECGGSRFERRDVVVAVCRGPLSPEGTYQGLLHPDILKGIAEPG